MSNPAACRFVEWYCLNRPYLINVLRKYGIYDADVFSDSFVSVYRRIVLDNLVISDFKSYFFRSCKFGYWQFKKKNRRYVFVENYDLYETV